MRINRGMLCYPFKLFHEEKNNNERGRYLPNNLDQTLCANEEKNLAMVKTAENTEY